MKSRHELREAVFKILFQVENTELDFIELLDLEQEEISTSIYVNKTLTEILEKKDEIDELISKNLKDWIDRFYVFLHMKYYIAIFHIKFQLTKL